MPQKHKATAISVHWNPTKAVATSAPAGHTVSHRVWWGSLHRIIISWFPHASARQRSKQIACCRTPRCAIIGKPVCGAGVCGGGGGRAFYYTYIYKREKIRKKQRFFSYPKRYEIDPKRYEKSPFFKENPISYLKTHFINFIVRFMPWASFFIPWVSISYLEFLFHTLGIFFHTIDIIFRPLSVFF